MAVFDGEAKSYDQWYDSKLGKFVDQVETDLAFRLFKPYKGMKVLDVGCGTGNFSLKLAEMGCQVIGIDISEEMLKVAQTKVKPGLDLEFKLMNTYELDFGDEEFDGVISMAAFEFIYEPQKAYNEMYRVLRPKGSLVIGTINLDSQWGELYLSDEIRENSVYKYADFKTLTILKSLNEKEVVESGQCLFIPPTIDENEISLELEKELSKHERGGFICVKWQKGV